MKSGRSHKKRHGHKSKLKTIRIVPGDTVSVHLRDNCDVDCEWVNLRKKKGDQIRWISKGKAFTVHFDDTPFADELGNPQYDFPVPARGSVDSGPPVLGEPDMDYEYTVNREVLAMSADPGLSVKE
ncbi:MAG TPA: hypothetical protein VMT28_09675 [Terriglobales bacterium]|jgi:hypothetical protein|nr:hypothetical protein [Terriglobales bacterium]